MIRCLRQLLIEFDFALNKELLYVIRSVNLINILTD